MPIGTTFYNEEPLGFGTAGISGYAGVAYTF